MGLICELYIIEDNEIKSLIDSPETFEEYLLENYNFIYGIKHIQNETVFSMDKGWDAAKYLIQENDKSPTNILQKLHGQEISPKSFSGFNYLFSNEVREINKWISKISLTEFKNSFDLKKMKKKEIYRIGKKQPESWDYLISHLEIYKNGFAKATEKESGIVISIG